MASANERDWRVIQSFVERARATPDRPALQVAGRIYSYAALLAEAERIATAIAQYETSETSPCTAVLAERSLVAYAGILAALMRGHSYVPLNPRFPVARNREILNRSGASSLIIAREETHRLNEMLVGRTGALSVVVAPDTPSKADLPGIREPRFAADGLNGLEARPRVHDNDVAYIMFTSGSTGRPKGVPVRHRNLKPVLDFAGARFAIVEADRLSQTFDLTFDLSVYDLFVAWSNGACLVVPSRIELLTAGKYINDTNITCWFSVPSLARQLQQMGALQANSFPSLRLSLFCGEGLPVEIASAWQGAAPNSVVENWYGPTEATISCTYYRFDPSAPSDHFLHGLVPIGRPFPGTETILVGADLSPLPDGEAGELLLGGVQVADGYLDDPEKTKHAFTLLPGQSTRFYRTGDKAVVDATGELQFLGRLDNQTKVQGYRVELGEVEAAIRRLHDDEAIVVPWPIGSPNAEYLVAVIEGTEHANPVAFLAALRESLPSYMVPRRVAWLKTLPTNANGKVDRKQIHDHLLNLEQTVAPLSVPHGDGANTLDALVQAIRAIKPDLSPEQIVEADNLFQIGMDSLGFMQLTRLLEQLANASFDQNDAAAIASMSVKRMAWAVGRKAAGAKIATRTHPFAARIADFVAKLPELMARNEPHAFIFGSSGVARAIGTAIFDETCARLAAPVRSVNAGLPGLDAEGMALMAELVSEACDRARHRLRVAIIEFDPVVASIVALEGVELSDVLRAASDEARPATVGEFAWNLETRGALPTLGFVPPPQAPVWLAKRQEEVVDIYLGRIDFDEQRMAAYLRAIDALSRVADSSLVYITPVDPNRVSGAQIQLQRRGHYMTLLARLRRVLTMPVLEGTSFRLTADDFADANHLNPTGAAKFSRELAQIAVSLSTVS